MKLWELQASLQQVRDFETPKVMLEQYITPADSAAVLLYNADFSYNDIADKNVCDLGCGTGMLSIGASLLGASSVKSLDVDEDALVIARENAQFTDIDNITFELTDISKLDASNHPRFDTVLLNPPFGTKHNKGIDMLFLDKAIELATGAVYSLHKTSTRNYIVSTLRRRGLQAEAIATLKYDLKKTMKFHKKKNQVIEVDVIRVAIN
ncbi:hypothetical protein P9112_002289 [Eukaryota sp. TZLM1-RC]